MLPNESNIIVKTSKRDRNCTVMYVVCEYADLVNKTHTLMAHNKQQQQTKTCKCHFVILVLLIRKHAKNLCACLCVLCYLLKNRLKYLHAFLYAFYSFQIK